MTLIRVYVGVCCLGNETYKRGQAEWAVWRAFTLGRSPGDGPPPVFKNRIKKLIDVDRETALSDENGVGYAFVEIIGGGSGVESQFAPIDVFCLGVALDLLDVGFKQGEIVLVMRHLRADLDHWFPLALGRPSLIDRQNHLAKFHPDLPVIERPGRAPLADARVFLILNRVELTEVLAIQAEVLRGPLVLTPRICCGMSGLEAELQGLMPQHRRTVIIVEIVALAQAVAAFLEKAPAMQRGRPRRQPGQQQPG